MENFHVSLDLKQPTIPNAKIFQPESESPSDNRAFEFSYSLILDDTVEPVQAIKASNPAIKELPKPSEDEKRLQTQMFKSILQTETSIPFDEENELKFVYNRASLMNRLGIPVEKTVDYICTNFDFELLDSPESLIHNVYQWNSEQHGGLLVDSNQIDSMSDEELAALKFPPKPSFLEIHGNCLLDTQTIPEDLIQALPGLLKEYVLKFSESRRRDVFLTSTFPVLASNLSGISAVYDGMTVFPVLNGFVLAPPASGKGAMNLAISLKSHTLELELKQYEADMELYKAQKAIYDKQTRKSYGK